MSDAKLMIAICALHLASFGCGGLLIYVITREDHDHPVWRDDSNGEGGGPDDSPQPPHGPPLPDATPARARLREPQRLADLIPVRERRRVSPVRELEPQPHDRE